MTVIVNLYGGPGSGKSTTRAGVFHKLKMYGVNVEEVVEYAKDLTWEGRDYALSNQLYVFAKQFKRMDMLMGKVDVIVTDSPLLLSSVYANDRMPQCFYKLVRHADEHPFRMDYFIERVKPYSTVGRNQTADEADVIASRVLDTVLAAGVFPTIIKGDEHAAPRIAMDVLAYLQSDNMHGSAHQR